MNFGLAVQWEISLADLGVDDSPDEKTETDDIPVLQFQQHISVFQFFSSLKPLSFQEALKFSLA